MGLEGRCGAVEENGGRLQAGDGGGGIRRWKNNSKWG